MENVPSVRRNRVILVRSYHRSRFSSPVFRLLVARILDVGDASLEETTESPDHPSIVTLHQYLAYFADKERRDLSAHIEDLAGESE